MTLNIQVKHNSDGTIKSRGIEWTDATWNPIAGCKHACRWTMPDGTIAECYAETVAERLATVAYPHGFAHHYWKPQHLHSPRRHKDPLKIFVGSMADVFGHWVPEEQIEAVLQVARECPHHTFQMLTKNATRTRDFDMPDNVWIGASSPPDFMWGKRLDMNQQRRMLNKTLEALDQATARIKWVSFEPLSWDVSDIVEYNHGILDWAVIGAASNGAKKYEPHYKDFTFLQGVLDDQEIPTFYKGNLRSLTTKHGIQWREDFPMIEPQQMRLL